MNLSLDAHYTVATSAYQRLLIGKPLSDKVIEKYRKMGYYGTGFLAAQRKEKIAKTRKKKVVLDINKFL